MRTDMNTLREAWRQAVWADSLMGSARGLEG